MADRTCSSLPPHSYPPDLISIVIPALNEADHIEATLASVEAQKGPKEVIVVDGGSADDTADKAAPRATVLQSAPGRARQMNCGAEVARGEALLFLHADTLLPPGALTAVRGALTDPAICAGTFRLRFDRATPLLRCYGLATRFKWRRFCYGDRGLFVRRRLFEAVGSYPDWPIFEDLELADRLHQRGGFRYLPLAVTTSARRFEQHGPLCQQLRNLALWLGYLCGVDPERVVRCYRYGA